MLVPLKYLRGRGVPVDLRLELFGRPEVPALFLSHQWDIRRHWTVGGMIIAQRAKSFGLQREMRRDIIVHIYAR